MYNYFGCWVKSQWQRAKFSLKDPIKTITIFSKLMKAMTKWKREDGSNADIQQPRAITNLSHQDKIYTYKIYRLRIAIATAIGTRICKTTYIKLCFLYYKKYPDTLKSICIFFIISQYWFHSLLH